MANYVHLVILTLFSLGLMKENPSHSAHARGVLMIIYLLEKVFHFLHLTSL